MDVLDRLIDLALWLVPSGRKHQPQIQRCIPPLGRDFEHVVFTRVNTAGLQPLGAGRKLLYEFLQFLGCRRVADGRLLPVKLRARQIQHRGGLHVGGLAEHLHQLRHVDESSKACVEPVASAIGRKLHRGDRFAKCGRPGIEVMEVVLFQRLGLEIPLHGEHLGHAVRDGRARGKDHTAPAVE